MYAQTTSYGRFLGRWWLAAASGLVTLYGCSDRPTSPSGLDPSAATSVVGNAGDWQEVVIPSLPDSLNAFNGVPNSEAYALNTQRRVVGWSERSYWSSSGGPCIGHGAFMLRQGQVIDLLKSLPNNFGCLGHAVAMDVNDTDAVVGFVLAADGDKYPWMWTSTGGPVIMAGVGRDVMALGVNNLGVAVGYNTSITTGPHALMWTSPTNVVDLHPAGYTSSIAVDIDDQGVVIGIVDGNVARWLPDGTLINSGRPIGSQVGYFYGISIRPLGINNRGIVAGTYSGPSFSDSGFTWTANLTFLTVPAPPQHVTDVSDKNRVVGWSVVGAGLRQAVTKRGSGAATWLSTPSGFTEAWATAVNSCGDVIGVATDDVRYRAVAWRHTTCDP